MNENLFKAAQCGDKAAFETLVEQNTGLVHSIAVRFRGRGADYEDLYQLGAMGLCKAIQRFDSGKGFCFSTYAVPLIMGEIRRFLRDDGIIKVSRHLRETSYKAVCSVNRLRANLGREPTLSEISSDSGIPQEELTAALEATQTPCSMFDESEDSSALINKIASDTDSEDECADKLTLRQALESMSEREKLIIINRYFRDKTQSRTALELGISQVQVSRIEKQILQKLKNELKQA